MPVADLGEYSDLDRAIEELLTAPAQWRISATARIFVENSILRQVAVLSPSAMTICPRRPT